MALCCLIYTFLYATYPRDRERARMEALIESEMLQITSDDSAADGQHSHQFMLSESGEPCLGDRTVIDMEYEGDASFDFDDDDDNDDDKTLMHRQLTFAKLSPQ